MVKKPGECGSLRDQMPSKGRPKSIEKQNRIKIIQDCLQKRMSEKEIIEVLDQAGIKIKPETFKKDKQAANRLIKIEREAKY